MQRRTRRLVVAGAVTATVLSVGTVFVLTRGDDAPCTDATAEFGAIVDYAQGTRGLPAREAARHALGMIPSDRRDTGFDAEFVEEAGRALPAGATSVSVGGVSVGFSKDRHGWRAGSFAICR